MDCVATLHPPCSTLRSLVFAAYGRRCPIRGSAILRVAMSRENIEAVRRVYDGWAQGAFSENDAFDPEVEFAMVDWPEGWALEAGKVVGLALYWDIAKALEAAGLRE